MMKEIDLVETLRKAPWNVMLWSNIYGDVLFDHISTQGIDLSRPIIVSVPNTAGRVLKAFSRQGRYYKDGECVLWPSKEIRDWSRWDEELQWREVEQWIADGVCEILILNSWETCNKKPSSFRDHSNLLQDFRKKPEVDPYQHLKDALAEGKQIEWKTTKPGEWIIVNIPTFRHPADHYRVYDPYRELKEAIAEGKTIEALIGTKWIIVWSKGCNEDFRFRNEIEYRIHDPYRELKEAYERGEIIQVETSRGWKDCELYSPGSMNNLSWMFPVKEYRIKTKEPEYVPFTFEDREMFRDKWVRDNNGKKMEEALVTYIDYDGIRIFNAFYYFNAAIKHLTFLDGTPFGKLVE